MFRWLLTCCFVLATTLAAAFSASAQAPSRRPNVILVMTDDQGYGDLGCHGNKIIKTPNIDSLYKKSVRLTNFHVDPTCAPTRSALMTGRYSGRVGVWHTIMGRSFLPADEVTMAEILRAAGYATAIFGKWHLGDNYPMRPQDQGFQEVLVNGGGGVGQTPDYWGNKYFDDTYFHNGKPQKMKGYCTDIWFNAAMKFISKNKDRPFFVYLPTNAAHGPYRVGDKYRQMYAKNKDVPNPNFYGMITNIDDNMGRLMAHLRQLGLEENTILIFMTDNGTAAGMVRGRGFNAGMRGNKGSEYEGGHRVPCFIRWPAGGIGGGKDVDELTAHLDLLPTLIDLCGLKSPQNVHFDGSSLAPLLKGKAKDWPERILVVESQRIEHPQMWRKCAVMTGQWRLVNGKELYNLKTDPGQKKNIAAEHPGMVKKLRQYYINWWKDISKNHDRYTRIVLGSDKENPSRLTCHDWHESNPPWNQSHIRRGTKANGFWAVDVAKAGEYEIELRRWPKTVPQPINQGPGVKAVKAKLKICSKEHILPVGKNAESVTFRLSLPAGPTRLQSWLISDRGVSRGAYFVYVRRLSASQERKNP